MFDTIFQSNVTYVELLTVLGAALITGIVFSLMCSIKSHSSRNFHITLAILPMAVAMIIAMVNGNVGAGVAVAGAFALVRFRSAQGNAKEIAMIFIAMVFGLVYGMGYVAYAIIFALASGLLFMFFAFVPLFESKKMENEKMIKIMIPEELDYTTIFDDLFEKYTKKHTLVRVKSTNLGSLFKLSYVVTLKDPKKEKEFIDELRVRNGNLEINVSRLDFNNTEL